MHFAKYLMMIVICSMFFSACAPAPEPEPIPVELPVLKITALPVIDALPIFVAEKEGLFQRAGIKVEFVQVASAPERDQLISSGQADGMINETLSTFFFNRENPQIQIVRYALKPTASSGHFFILASKDSGIIKPEQLAGVEIGVSQGTIIEYVTYRLLQEKGLLKEDIKTVAVPKISDRMALLDSGELKAAVMPDPLAALAVQNGATIIMDDSQFPQYGFSVYSFRKSIIDSNPEAIKAFLLAIEQAVTRINQNLGGYKDILMEKNLVPAPLLDSYQLPQFTKAGIPTEAEWNDAQSWAKEMDLLSVDVAYNTSVTKDYLPSITAVPQ